MTMRGRRRLFASALLAAAHLSAIFVLTESFGVSSPSTTKTIRVCHNKNCTKKRGGEALLDTLRDLLPAPSSGVGGGSSSKLPGLSIERSGCLSQCGRGPNVLVVAGKEEKMYFGVEDATTASALLDVVYCSGEEECPIALLVAAAFILDAEKASSPSEKEKLLTKAIEATTDGGDPSLTNSFACAHAHYLRADARLETGDVDGAIADARLAAEKAPGERRAWRALADALERSGDVEGAIDALRRLAGADPAFATKVNGEIAKLAGLGP